MVIQKIEITKLIDENMSKEPITFRDLLDKSITIRSYEQYIQIFSLIKNTFKDKIPEFYDRALGYIDKMEDFINKCKMYDNTDELKNYINNHFKEAITGGRYNNNIETKIIFIDSLKNDNAKSEEAIIQIYKELGYDNLISYIELLKYPSHFSSYLNDSSKQIVAMHYMLYKTNHHSPNKLQRNTSAQNLYSRMEKNIDSSINEIIKEKDSYIDFMNEEKVKINQWQQDKETNYNEWFGNSKNAYDEFMTQSLEKIENLENTYSEKLKVEKPAEFMKEKSVEYANQTKFWIKLDVIVGIILLVLLALIIDPKVEFNEKVISINLFSNELPVYSSIIILAMICLIIYILRIMIKMTISSKHLSEEYNQKHILAFFYLSLINAGKMDEKIGQAILTLLFSKVDTGLIKNDSSGEYESIIKMLTSSGK